MYKISTCKKQRVFFGGGDVTIVCEVKENIFKTLFKYGEENPNINCGRLN